MSLKGVGMCKDRLPTAWACIARAHGVGIHSMSVHGVGLHEVIVHSMGVHSVGVHGAGVPPVECMAPARREYE